MRHLLHKICTLLFLTAGIAKYEECDISEVCITLRKRQYSISMHTDYDFDRAADMPLEKFYRCQKALHGPRPLSRPPAGFTNFLPKPYQRPVAKMHKSVPCYTIQALAWLCRLKTVSHYSSFVQLFLALLIKMKKPSFPFKLYYIRYILADFQSPQVSAH